MELKICHLYPDVLNLYGDRGNILCLRKRLEWRGIECRVDYVKLGDKNNLAGYDLFFIGGGQDFDQEILLEDLTGLSGKEAETKLNALGLTAVFRGSGETVTAQLPEGGQTVPGGSGVLLYLEGSPEEELITVPDFAGMNRQQASDAAGAAGLFILVAGNEEISPQVVVTAQNSEANTQVPRGTTIILTFTDITARD